MRLQQEHWSNAATGAMNLSQAETILGRLVAAVQDAEQSVELADRSGDAFYRMTARATLAHALFQQGQELALERFREAEAIQVQRQREYPLLYSLRGFNYCELLLGEAERAAWQRQLGLESSIQDSELHQCCLDVEHRGQKMFEWRTPDDALFDIALDHLTLARSALYLATLQRTPAARSEQESRQAMQLFRAAGTQDGLPGVLLTRAWVRLSAGNPDGARADLDEAWQVASRGDMRLFMADIHLHRARLFRNSTALAKARALIEECGYWRRKEELEDAEKAAKGWKDY